MREIRRNKGITLIALVITIIILLILAGISIVTLVGENGILGKANKGAEEYKKQVAEEKIKLALMSYQVNKENTTIYDELIKIEGLTSITPTDRNGGPPYTVVVDSFKFLIKDDLSIEYKGEEDTNHENLPEITNIEYESAEVNNLTITITAKTEDVAGLKEIIVNYKKVEADKIKYEVVKVEKVEGKKVSITVEIPVNGEYVIQAVGKNSKIGKKEITIRNIKEGNMLATISAGEVDDQAKVAVTISGQSQGKAIQKIELYANGQNVKTYKYEDLETKKEESCIIENLEFYKNVECYVKIWDNQGNEVVSEAQTVKNTKIIKTATDLRNLATQVNQENNSFEGKNIQLIEDIPIGQDWIPIGYWDGAGEYTGKYFAGTFEGNNHTITIASLSADSRYRSMGLFGLVIGGNLNNIIVNGSQIANTDIIAGIVGALKDGSITNCTNNSIITNTNTAQNPELLDLVNGGIAGHVSNARILNCTNTNTIYGKTQAGGICGLLFKGNNVISNCNNSGTIKCYDTRIITWGEIIENYGIVGGICGEIKWETSTSATIENCINTGEITGNASTILPKGIVAGGIVGLASRSNIITSQNRGRVHYGDSSGTTNNGGALGGIAGVSINSTINQCFNEATITSKYSGSYTMQQSGGIIGFSILSTVKNCYNKGEVYGLHTVGGIIGWTGPVGGIAGRNYFYNNYNAQETIAGQSGVGNYIGYSDVVTGSYNSGIKGKGAIGSLGADNNYSNYTEYTLQEMKTTGSGLLTLLSNGEGNGIWEQENNVNEGLPYLVNNRP